MASGLGYRRPLESGSGSLLRLGGRLADEKETREGVVRLGRRAFWGPRDRFYSGQPILRATSDRLTDCGRQRSADTGFCLSPCGDRPR